MHLKLFLSVLTLLLAGLSAQAGLTLTLLPSVQSGVGSNEVAFAGVMTNSNLTGNLFLNNIQLSFNGAATNQLAAKTNVFFVNVPGILLPGEIYSDVVFAVSLNPAAPPGIYSGTVAIQGGTNILAATDLASQTFQVSLSPAALAITMSNTNIVLSWASPPGNFILQQNSDLRTNNWMTVTNAPTIENGQNRLILPPSTGRQFYRLDYP
jgi:hypothetical protein